MHPDIDIAQFLKEIFLSAQKDDASGLSEKHHLQKEQ